MACDRAPRWRSVGASQTGPLVSPNYYNVNYYPCCSCRGSNWAPFLSCSGRTTKFISDLPPPNAYNIDLPKKIIGGSSLRYTTPRFQSLPDPIERFEEKPPCTPRLKGYLYHCRVPFNLSGWTPTIPSLKHRGYIIDEWGKAIECCVSNPDLSLGPAYYPVSFGTFCSCYKGCFWSKSKTKRESHIPSDVPGVGTYCIQKQPNPLEEYLNELRNQRKKTSCSPRYIDSLQAEAIRNNYPSPNEYDIRNINKCPKTKKKLVPKKCPRKTVSRCANISPAPNQYNDPRTAFTYLTKPSCLKELNSFLTNAPRFPGKKSDGKPPPNSYNIASFIDELKNKVSPYAIRDKVAFDTTVPKKLYFLPPEKIPIPNRKKCKCSSMPSEPEPTLPLPNPSYPFTSTEKRFRGRGEDYPVSCATYSIIPSFNFIRNQKSFKKSKNGFVFKEKRFGKFYGFNSEEDKSYIPSSINYDKSTYKPWKENNSGTFGKALRFTKTTNLDPGPMDYNVGRTTFPKPTFNVTFPGYTTKNKFQVYRLKLMERKNIPETVQPSSVKKVNTVCPVTNFLYIRYPSDKESESMRRKKLARRRHKSRRNTLLPRKITIFKQV